MSSGSLIIRNANVVNEGTEIAADVHVVDGRISNIAPSISASADEEIDAGGNWLVPGMIDDQVHFREPGSTHKGDMRSESAAAVAGGITSFMDMPNTSPPTLTAEAIEKKKAIAAQSAAANYAFHLGVSHDNLDDVAAIDPTTVAGTKVFMGASTGNMLVDDPDILDKLFARVPTILLAHCEDSPTIAAAEEKWRRDHGGHPPMSEHPNIRSEQACYLSSSQAVARARKHGTRLHVLHITTAKELELFDDQPLDDKKVTAEVCVHHLTFDDRDYERLGTHLKCNPAVKTPADREALRKALSSNVIDVIGTDHAPHTADEKNAEYFDAPAGLPLAQHALPALFQLVTDGVLDIHTLVAKTSHRVADLFDVKDRGYIREGYWADLAIVRERPQGAPDAPVLSKCGWSPFVGKTFSHDVATTVVNGHIAWHEGAVAPARHGLALEFSR